MPPQESPRRLSSNAVKIGMISALSLTVAACGNETTTAWCVDGDSRTRGADKRKVVSDAYCDDDDAKDGDIGYGRYYWYYGGKNRGGYVSGGSRVGPSDGKIKTSSGRTLSRNGFGGGTSRGGS